MSRVPRRHDRTGQQARRLHSALGGSLVYDAKKVTRQVDHLNCPWGLDDNVRAVPSADLKAPTVLSRMPAIY